MDNYGSRLGEDHGLEDLQDAITGGATHFYYDYPPGTSKISGLAVVNHDFFQWICGVGINDEDIFAPVQDLKQVLMGAVSLTALLVGTADLFHRPGATPSRSSGSPGAPACWPAANWTSGCRWPPGTRSASWR